MEKIYDKSEAPPDFNEEQKEMCDMMMRAASTSPDFVNSATEVLARNPNLCRDFIESHRRYTIENISKNFRQDIGDVPPEMLREMLRLSPEVLVNVASASSHLNSMNIELELDEVREVINIAVANSVMEESVSQEEGLDNRKYTMPSPATAVFNGMHPERLRAVKR